MKRTILVGLLVMVLALPASAVALGGSGYPTSLSIQYSRSSGGYFSGKLRSHAGCVDGRKVAVYRKQSGSDPSVGSSTVAASGKWRAATGKAAAGDYYAKTPRRNLGGGAGSCAAAKSATTHVS